MNVYRVSGDVAYGHLPLVGTDGPVSVNRKVYEMWDKAAGRRNNGHWQAPRFDLDLDRTFLPVDCIAAAMGGRALLLNLRAREALSPLLLTCGEFLPVIVGDYDYEWFNCTTLIDAADQDLIEGRHDPTPGVPPEMWMAITRWAFRPDRLMEAPPMFAVPQSLGVEVLCTDLLKKAVESHDLIGFRFDFLWSPETGGVEQLGLAQCFGEPGRKLAEANRLKWEAARARLGAAWPPPPRRRKWLSETQ